MSVVCCLKHAPQLYEWDLRVLEEHQLGTSVTEMPPLCGSQLEPTLTRRHVSFYQALFSKGPESATDEDKTGML